MQNSGGVFLWQHVLLHRLHHLHKCPALLGRGPTARPEAEEQLCSCGHLRHGLGGGVAYHHPALPVRPGGPRVKPQHPHLPRRHKAQSEEDGCRLLPDNGNYWICCSRRRVHRILRPHAQGS